MNYIASGYRFGHAVEFVDGKWMYSDTKEVITEDILGRKCPRCKQSETPEGADPCIANLPGVIAACCGHGLNDFAGKGYILFSDSTCIRFTDFEVERYGKNE